MTATGINNYLSRLTSEINGSVERLKSRGAPETSETFAETAAGQTSAPSTGISPYPRRLLGSTLAYQLSLRQEPLTKADSDYAAASYHAAGEVLGRPKVILDLMFKNNREFDFKV